MFISPNGTKLWVPNVRDGLKLVEGDMFCDFGVLLDKYVKYAGVAGFGVRKGQTLKKNGAVTHKYLRCNRAGQPQTKKVFDSVSEASLNVRQSSFMVSDCKAHLLAGFCKETNMYKVLRHVEGHNHSLIASYNMDLAKGSRKLPFSTKQFIHNMSLNRVGPVKAHNFMVSMMGGHHNVRGTSTDFKNFTRSIRLYIGDRDSQMLLDRLEERAKCLPEFYFDFVVRDGRLHSIFWADELSKINYEAFGDVLAFDATYQTNK